jgi:uncharacterized membrane protein YkvA (DUF1232 family)
MGLIKNINPFYRLRVWWRVLRDKRTPTWSKVLFVVLAAGYAAMPLDLIPDFIIGLGWLDDLVVLPTLAWLATKAAPKFVRQEAEDDAIDQA